MSSGSVQTERQKSFAGKPAAATEGVGQAAVAAAGEYDENLQPVVGPFVLIENTSAKLHGIGLPPPKRKNEKGEETNEYVGVLAIDPKVKLQPGMNKVPQEDWTEAKTQKMVQIHIKRGIFREHLKAKNLSEMEIGDALAVIPKTYDRKLLGEWHQVDKRPEVQESLKAQFDLLKRQHRGEGEESGLT